MRYNKKIAIIVSITSLMLSTIGCEKYDDSALVARMEKAEADIKDLQTLVSQINTTLSGLVTTVDALQKQERIVSVTKLEDGSGYVVEFSVSGRITIYNGKNGLDGTNGTNGTNGQDGKTPTIGVKLDADGNYYWTVNGEYLLDENNNKIAATAHVATPQLRINDGNFEISYNGGVTWEVIGEAGNTGAVVFSQIDDGSEAVTFTLGDGTTIVIPKVGAFVINVDTEIIIAAGDNTEVSYTISSADESTIVDAFGTKGFEAEVTVTSYQSGKVSISAPNPITKGKVYIVAVRGDGVTSARILSLDEGKLVVDESVFAAKVPAAGGNIEVPVSTNIEFDVSVDPGNLWIHYIETKAMHNKTVILSIDENTSEESREGTIYVLSDAGVKPYTIIQAGTADSPSSGGGSADLGTFNNGQRNTTVGTYQSTDGWIVTNSRVNNALKSGTPRFEDVGDGFRPILAARSGVSGTLTSPILNGGCGSVTIDYTRFTSQTGSNFTITILKENGDVIKSETHTDDALAQWARNSLSFDFNISGAFKIMITGEKCSNTSSTTNDDLMILSLVWTGYSE